LGHESLVSYTDQVGRHSRRDVTRPTCQWNQDRC
jgi:hypothetical protein